MDHANNVFPNVMLGIASLILIGACAQAPTKSPGRVLSGEEVRNLLTYNSAQTSTAEGGIWRAYHPDADSEIGRYTKPSGTTISNRSRKTYKDDAVCAEWSLNDWGTQCYEFKQDGAKLTYRNVNAASDYGEVQVIPGNAFNF